MNKNKSVKIFLVRHGEASAAWNEDPDPDLSETGKQQSKILVKEISTELDQNLNVISSPLLRALNTAKPLQEKIHNKLVIDSTFAEIPSPGIPLSKRREWLRSIFNANIDELEEPQLEWRKTIIDSIKLIDNHTIIFSHFMVINCIVGWIRKSEKFVSFFPDNCSVTKLIKQNNKIIVDKLGRELPTTVQ